METLCPCALLDSGGGLRTEPEELPALEHISTHEVRDEDVVAAHTFRCRVCGTRWDHEAYDDWTFYEVKHRWSRLDGNRAPP